jgi:serine/threonine protein kinase
MRANKKTDYTELDVYSFGLTLFVLLDGDSFIQDEKDKYRNPTDEEVDTWSKSDEITKLHPIGNYVIQMINKNPNNRPSSSDLVQAVKQGFPDKIIINPKEKNI